MIIDKLKNTLIIAEIGINHNGDIKNAFKLIDAAKQAGADAVKFQTYITEKRTKKNSPIYEILKKCELPFEDFKILKNYAEKKSLIFFSTAFDIESLDYLLSELKIKILKIASFDSSNKDLIKPINKYKVDLIISLGLTNKEELDKTIKLISNKNILCLMHCVTAYPIKNTEANLAVIHFLKKKYSQIIGYSDHTKDIIVPEYAVAAGAKIIEKHFMINHNDNVIDKAVSIDSNKFKTMVKNIRNIEKIFGKEGKIINKVEKKFKFLKRNKLTT